ncbi:MAG: hypothetical protein ABIR59_03225 [Gemmatimonadales bacterium]
MRSELLTGILFALLLATTAQAQVPIPQTAPLPAVEEPAEEADDQDKAEPLDPWRGRKITIQHFRPQDKRGINVFETSKDPGVEYKGFKLDFGAAFTSQVQNLEHSNTADPRIVSGVDANELIRIGFGPNTSTANLYMHAQLAKGVRVQLTSYLSSRHHNETWVKDGFILIDDSPIDLPPLKKLMENVTLKIGHFEINYGDQHFRRSDNGNAMYNPFVGNFIVDAFATEIGAEVYVKKNSFMIMGGLTGAELRGTVTVPQNRGPALLGKVGYDRQLNTDLRVRVTGSMYSADKSNSNTLYSGDRAGSRYYYVLENTTASESAQFTSGRFNPGFRNNVRAFQINPFVKYRGLELFGALEMAKGRTSAEETTRDMSQYAAEVIFRFMPEEMMFVGARYNQVDARLAGMASDVSINRVQIAAGWFVLPTLLVKAEYVNQKYKNFLPTDIRNGGKFNGFMFEGVVAF